MLRFYGSLIYKNFRMLLVYRSNIVSSLFSAIIMIFAQAEIWKALYGGAVLDGTTVTDTITYTVLQFFLGSFLCIDLGGQIGTEYYQGLIGQRMIFPIRYKLFDYFSLMGRALANLVFCILPMFVICVVFYGFSVPTSLWTFPATLVSMVLGGIVFTLISVIMGYTAFWLRNNWYIRFFRGALFTVFGGTFIPLWFFPEWMVGISRWLPFYYSSYAPMEVYLERVQGMDTLVLILLQCVWIVILLGLEALIWRRAQRKLVVFGG